MRRVPKRINSTPTTETTHLLRAQPRTNRFTSEIHCEERRGNDVSHRKRSGFLVAARPSFPRTRESRSSHRRPTGDELLWPPKSGRGFGLDIIDSGPRNPIQTPLLSPQSTIANRQLATSMKLVGANPKARSEGLDRLPGISNYFIGDDPRSGARASHTTLRSSIAKFIRHRPRLLRNSPAVGI